LTILKIIIVRHDPNYGRWLNNSQSKKVFSDDLSLLKKVGTENEEKKEKRNK